MGLDWSILSWIQSYVIAYMYICTFMYRICATVQVPVHNYTVGMLNTPVLFMC